MLKSARYWLSVGCVTLSMTVSAQAQDMDSDAFDQEMDSQYEGVGGAVSDPLESVNRVTFAFNEMLDTWLLKPVAQGYTYITPDPLEGLVVNFFSNLGEIRNIANSLLQLELSDAASSTGRFLINSTVGLFGLVDVGSAMGLEYKYNDFGVTLADWSVPAGPYVMLPFLGPRTLRSTAGMFPDWYVNPTNYVSPEKDQYLLMAAEIISLRAQLLDREGLVVGDKYIFIRDAYLQHREFLISGSRVVQDEF